AEAELRTHRSVKQMKQTSGTYTEMEWIKSDSTPDQAEGGSASPQEDGKANHQRRAAEHGITLNSREWQEGVEKLAKDLGSTKIGRARPKPVLSNVEGGALGRGRKPRHSEAATAYPPPTDTLAQIKTGVLSPLQEDEGH